MKSVSCGVAMGLERLGLLVACAGISVSLIQTAQAEDRTISMYHIHTKETITVTFKRNGKYVPEALQQLNHFMRDWRLNLETRMDPALIDIIWELHEQLGSRVPVEVICGYRSSGTNEMLRRTVGGQAKNSRHITGQAADLVFPDVPLKQLRYSALVMERGGVGFYPASGVPFVHVDTGNVRHWPAIPHTELAALYPNGHSRHGDVTAADYRVAIAHIKSSGGELPWVITHKKVAGPMLASLTPSESVESQAAVLQKASLTVQTATPDSPKPALLTRPEPLSRAPAEAPEVLLSEEGEEQEDVIEFVPLPAVFLLAEKPLSYSDIPDGQEREPVLKKIGMLMVASSSLASEEFDHRLQIEDLYEANTFKGPAVGFIRRQRARMASAPEAAGGQATR